jgi:hypothetical protein
VLFVFGHLTRVRFRCQQHVKACGQGERCHEAIPPRTNFSTSQRSALTCVALPTSAGGGPVHRGLFKISSGDQQDSSQLRFPPTLLDDLDDAVSSSVSSDEQPASRVRLHSILRGLSMDSSLQFFSFWLLMFSSLQRMLLRSEPSLPTRAQMRHHVRFVHLLNPRLACLT